VRLEARVHKGEMEALVQFCAELLDHLNREEIISVPHLTDGPSVPSRMAPQASDSRCNTLATWRRIFCVWCA
jgi:hypothetical protein